MVRVVPSPVTSATATRSDALVEDVIAAAVAKVPAPSLVNQNVPDDALATTSRSPSPSRSPAAAAVASGRSETTNSMNVSPFSHQATLSSPAATCEGALWRDGLFSRTAARARDDVEGAVAGEVGRDDARRAAQGAEDRRRKFRRPAESHRTSHRSF